MTGTVLLVCTGNVARSVMARCMLEWLAEAEGRSIRLATAGTHAVEGQPAGARTQAALYAATPLESVPIGRHRSHQLAAEDLAGADLVVAMETAHVRYVRRHHPEASGRTATLRRLCRDLPPPPPGLAARVAALDLAAAYLPDADDVADGAAEDVADRAAEDVADPAGGTDGDYAACAAELWALCTQLATLL